MHRLHLVRGDWMMVEGEKEKKQQPKKRETLRLPKKPADPDKVTEVTRKINEKYGHIPTRRTLH